MQKEKRAEEIIQIVTSLDDNSVQLLYMAAQSLKLRSAMEDAAKEQKDVS